MVAPLAPLFQWKDGELKSPAEVAREQRVAEALMFAKPQATGFWGALGQIGSAASGSLLDSRADASEQQGREAASALFSGLGSGASTDAIAQALMNPAAAWATPGQQGVAEALLNSGLKQQDPAYQMDLAYKQAQIDALRNPASTGSQYFGSTLPWQDAEGNLQYHQLSQGGLPQLPPGARWLEPTSTVNTGTAQTVVGRNTGAVQGAIPIDNMGASQDTAVGTGLGQQQLTTIDAGRVAAGNNAKLGVLESILTTAPQGGQGRLVQLAGGLGVDLGGLTEVQAAQAVINQMVPLQRAPGSGTMSDADLELYKASLPSIINQPESNALIISTQKALNDYTIAHANIEQQLITGQIDEATALSLKQSIPNPVASFLAATRAGAAAGAAPPQADGWQEVAPNVRIRPIGP